MKYLYQKKQKIALCLLFILGTNILAPAVTYALTSGPVQPETQGFQPAGVSDMVDLQTGSLKYNIPLLDIDGYPINLNYQSGSGMDDEASWVGLGWNLNPGAINRQVRGIPDDFSGDTVETDHYVKPEVTVGGRVNAKFEFKGIALAAGVTLGIFNNNYTGVGAEIGANAGISYSLVSDGFLTSGLGLGVNSSTQSGVSLSPSVNLSIQDKINDDISTRAGLTASLGYNSRSGLKDLTLGSSFGAHVTGTAIKTDKEGVEHTIDGDQSNDAAGSTISYNTEPVNPSIQIPFTTTYDSFSFNVGPTAFAAFPSFGGTGYRSIRQVQKIVNIKPGYGFLYAEQGKNNPDAVMDFTREKDNPIVPGIPNIALPIHTPDVWAYSSQAGSGQFRLYRGGSGIFFDNQASDQSFVNTAGVDLGIGLYFHGGLTYFKQNTSNNVHKWQNGNAYLVKGDFQNANNTAPNQQQVYFRQTGEKGAADPELYGQAYGNQALEVSLTGQNANASYNTTSNQSSKVPENTMGKMQRRLNRTEISYLTAKEASVYGLDTAINQYALNTSTTNSYPSSPTPIALVHRVSGYKKAHHISELTVTDGDGKRMVYGIPVYNTVQDEYSFAVGGTGRTGTGNTYPANNQVAVPANPAQNNLGVDNYYQKEHKGAYATSYLLTAILSPDYVDKTGNGISDDDLGTAIKFNYTKVPGVYKWRSPYQNATLNKALLADPDDDKGSIVYGEKELYYVQSIESKTKIAYFITADRDDDLGVLNWQTAGRDTSVRQKYLKQIRLYSKADMSKPIKVVNFQYSYALCPGVPNNATSGEGKLTLTKVWFDYGNSDKGQYHPYTFNYNVGTADSSVIHYGYMMTDRWGTYKKPSENSGDLTNEEYPYTTQDTNILKQNVAIWQLSQINLPTGGNIKISYESGDYAYVQNKKAMEMSAISTLLTDPSTTTTTLNNTHGLKIYIGNTLSPPGSNVTQWFKDNFLDGSDYIYTKLYVELATGVSNSDGCNYDFVPCYALVSSVTVSGGYASVMLQNMTVSGVTANPISIAAWQLLKNEYPRYAYPGFDSRVQSANSSILAAVTAVVDAAKNLTELTQNFYQKASGKKYASVVDLSKSFVKITNVAGRKLGGPARVCKITIDDAWSAMSGNRIADAQYGQAYNYTTIDNGQVISSGVATYEPYIGNDENALKQPVPYVENIKGAISNYFDLEQPFGESLYPAPEIGYSKVTVRDLDQHGNPSDQTGYIVNEFYTAKDFPVKVTVLPLINNTNRPASHYSLTSSNSIDQQALSQGYCIQLNDMHGKQKAVTVFNQSGAEISSTAYNYKVDSTGALNNQVDIIGQNGIVQHNQIIGQELEFFTDFREQVTNNTGNTINIGADVFPVGFLFFPFVLPHNPYGTNNDLKTFRSACAVKVVQSYGILDNVVKTENGSTITTQNIAYDGLTGEPLVTKTQNEFEGSIYSANLPAYWVYPRMGGAYQNSGIYMSGLTTNAHGELNNYTSYLQQGDEVADTCGHHFWVINTLAYSGTGNTEKLIDRYGKVQRGYAPKSLVKVIRSGYRNVLSAGTTSIVCLNNPLVTTAGVTTLQLVNNTDLSSLKVLNTSATTYAESWGMKNTSIVKVNDTIPTPVVQGTHDCNVDSVYGKLGLIINPSHYTNINVCWTKALIRSGIWLKKTPQTGDLNDPYFRGILRCFNIDSSKTYYVGYSGDNEIRVFIDNILVDSTTDYYHWYMDPVNLLAGNHQLRIEFINKGTGDVGGPASAGVEIYSNTLAQLEDTTVTLADLKIVFATNTLIPNPDVQSFIINGAYIYRYTYPNGSPINVCDTSLLVGVERINPYTSGFLGNWRPYQTEVFQQSRNNTAIGAAGNTGINVKNSGYINDFYSYWYYTSGAWTKNTIATQWITANTVTLYDQYGQQLENKDALGRFSAANFDFNGELPAAVASNATNREIYAASLEDSKFTPGSGATCDTCNIRQFIEPSTGLTIKQLADSTISHTGNYSAKLPADGVTMNTIVYTALQKTVPYLTTDTARQYITKSDTGLYPNGFEPMPNKSYIFDTWVYDATPNDKSINLAVTVNGTALPLKCKAVVEGWKLMEGIINIGNLTAGSPLSISIVPNSGFNINIDDIRMHPFNAQMKSYAYDDKTMRLMAELDENCFATFYEYDDEGLLIRVKKETEKGIMTLKESRSSYKKIQ
jgi:hypothetical protein